MSALEVLQYIATWGLAGAIAFSLFVVVAFRSGLVFTARKPDGTLKQRVPATGIAVMVGFLLLVIAFFLLANRIGIGSRMADLQFGQLFLLNLALYLVLFVFDTIVIDAAVLGVWRPHFLQLPKEMGSSSMAAHIVGSLPVGLLSGVLLALSTATISYLLWARQ